MERRNRIKDRRKWRGVMMRSLYSKRKEHFLKKHNQCCMIRSSEMKMSLQKIKVVRREKKPIKLNQKSWKMSWLVLNKRIISRNPQTERSNRIKDRRKRIPKKDTRATRQQRNQKKTRRKKRLVS